MTQPLLHVESLQKEFRAKRGGVVRAVTDVSFAIAKGQTLGLVGESGSGKSTVAKLILRLEAPTGGRIVFDGQNVSHAKGEALRRYRANVQAVFQDPYSSLNPRMRVGESVAEPLIANTRWSRAEIERKSEELLTQVGLDAAAGRRYPHAFSGGQRQRIAIARALALQPRLLVLDEPVSALDASVRGQVLNVLSELQASSGVSYLFISHDLDVVAHLCDMIAVMYLGCIVEIGPRAIVHGAPKHPYTQALLSAVLPRRTGVSGAPSPLRGEPPSPLDSPPGCAFYSRCAQAQASCAQTRPALRATGGGVQVACHLIAT